MATSSITASFHCSGTKAANTFVDLLLAENPPAEWTAPAPARTAHECVSKRDLEVMVMRIVDARKHRRVA